VANGLSLERLLAQREEIARVQAEFGDSLRIYHGIELEIRADGTLDYPDEVLAALDVVVASLHTGLRQDRATITPSGVHMQIGADVADFDQIRQGIGLRRFDLAAIFAQLRRNI
ncbi:MAG: hypothetical protein CUN49_18155, partial [Candidatus Thermofonsia Clade 1 bacterium]